MYLYPHVLCTYPSRARETELPLELPADVGILTLVLLAATIVSWFALEFFYVLNGQPSISEQVWILYAQWPALGMFGGLIVGLLLGHFFFGH